MHTQASATVCSSIGVHVCVGGGEGGVCASMAVWQRVCSSIGVGGGGGILCFIVVLSVQTCVGITTRTVVWPLGAMVGV